MTVQLSKKGQLLNCHRGLHLCDYVLCARIDSFSEKCADSSEPSLVIHAISTKKSDVLTYMFYKSWKRTQKASCTDHKVHHG